MFVHVTGKILTLATYIHPCLTSAASFRVSVHDWRGENCFTPFLLFLLGHKLNFRLSFHDWILPRCCLKRLVLTSFHTAEGAEASGIPNVLRLRHLYMGQLHLLLKEPRCLCGNDLKGDLSRTFFCGTIEMLSLL